MKNIALLIALFLTFQVSMAQLYNYENGDTVNDFTVVDTQGISHNLYNYTAQGKYVFIDFFYANCGGCQIFMPVFNEFYDKYGCNEGDVVCISINSGADKDGEVIDFENAYGGAFNHAPAVSIDGGCEAVITDFNPMYYPAKCVIGPDNAMVNSDISPYGTIADLEATFPVGFDPQPMECTIGTEEIVNDFDFSIYPNPADGNGITIQLNTFNTATIRIFNILGKEVFTHTLTKATQKIYPNLNTGTYFISVQTDFGKVTHKLIVK